MPDDQGKSFYETRLAKLEQKADWFWKERMGWVIFSGCMLALGIYIGAKVF